MDNTYKSPGRVMDSDVSAYYANSDPMEGGLVTKRGNPVGRGRIAVDPSVIPFRSVVWIPGYGWATADDTGGRIKGNRIDLGYGASEGQIARDYGHQNQKVHVYPPDTPYKGMKDPAALEAFLRSRYEAKFGKGRQRTSVDPSGSRMIDMMMQDQLEGSMPSQPQPSMQQMLMG
jgi:3D (Asp-Asp-Asp) domain-containing protein